VTEQVDVELLASCANAQLGELKEPELPVGPFRLKLTSPRGNDVPPESVSLTVAVQVVCCFSATELGRHDTVVDVDRGVTTVRVAPVVSLLAAWTPSSPL
jgi:hypothetical protein